MDNTSAYRNYQKRVVEQLHRISKGNHFKRIFGKNLTTKTVSDYIAAQWSEESFVEERIKTIIRLDSRTEQLSLKEAA